MKYKTQVIIGAQWGDEGKGKISDYLAQKADVVVRYQGGNNAGHSIEFDNKRFALKHIPSGIFNPKTKNVMAQGMVINPKMLIDEINELKKKGITNFQLFISDRAHVIMPYHLDLDGAFEELKKSVNPAKMIGTTKKGIGPAYEDKAARIGIRFGDFINKEGFREALDDALLIKNKVLESFGLSTYKTDQIFNEYFEYAKELSKFVIETSTLLMKEAEDGKEIIFEGAQGVMLCIENGTYPFVTSSSPTASSIPLGTGLSTKYINKVTGIVKAYSTRVGGGAMPTIIEQTNPKVANHIRKKGNEFGTVTGRKRMIGWLDAVALKHAIRTSGFTDLSLMLLDVLDELEEIKIATSYKLNDEVIDYIPGSNTTYNLCQPIYIKMPGWKKDITNVTNYEQLPQEAKNYIAKIEEILNVPITRFSVGPDRLQTIEIKKV